MKKIIYFTILVALAGTKSWPQKLSSTKVPSAVKTAFSKTHTNVSTVSWSKENANFEAEFTLNGKQTCEVYTAKGIFVESEIELKFAELPTAVKMKLKDQKITETAKITKANGSIVYEAEVKGKDLLFDADGNPVKL